MKHNYILFSVFVLVFLISCNTMDYIKDDHIRLDYAISSFFSPDSLFIIKIDSVQKFFFKSGEEMNARIDAVVLTSLSSNEHFALQKIDDSSFLYTSPLVCLKKGGEYKIEVFLDSTDEVISAIDSIPNSEPSFNLLSTGVRIDRNAMGDASLVNATCVILLVPPKNMLRSYYELKVFTKSYARELNYFAVNEVQVGLESSSILITSEDYYPTGTSIDKSKPSSLLFSTSGDVDSVLIDFVYCPDISLPDVLSEHDLRIELSCVSYAYYKYKTSLYKQKNALRGDVIFGAAQPVSVYSNVNYGTGIFAGYTVLSKKVHVDKFVYYD